MLPCWFGQCLGHANTLTRRGCSERRAIRHSDNHNLRKLIFLFKVRKSLCRFEKCKKDLQNVYKLWLEFVSILTGIHVIGGQRV